MKIINAHGDGIGCRNNTHISNCWITDFIEDGIEASPGDGPVFVTNCYVKGISPIRKNSRVNIILRSSL